MTSAPQSSRILLVDDEPFIMEATATLLRNAGHTVWTCGQWAGVASMIRSEQPELILMDYNMPSLKGDDLCQILKRNNVGTGMKIVLFSSESELDLIEIAGRCGADGYIKKDVPTAILLQRINTVLETLH